MVTRNEVVKAMGIPDVEGVIQENNGAPQMAGL